MNLTPQRPPLLFEPNTSSALSHDRTRSSTDRRRAPELRFKSPLFTGVAIHPSTPSKRSSQLRQGDQAGDIFIVHGNHLIEAVEHEQDNLQDEAVWQRTLDYRDSDERIGQSGGHDDLSGAHGMCEVSGGGGELGGRCIHEGGDAASDGCPCDRSGRHLARIDVRLIRRKRISPYIESECGIKLAVKNGGFSEDDIQAVLNVLELLPLKKGTFCRARRSVPAGMQTPGRDSSVAWNAS